MSLVDPLSDALINLKNRDMASKRDCVIRPRFKLLLEVLKIMKENGFINSFEAVEDGREGLVKIDLNGKINDCKAIKPRFAVKKDEFEKFEKRFLPSKDLGLLLVSTPKGLMTHRKAKEELTGGRLIAYIY